MIEKITEVRIVAMRVKAHKGLMKKNEEMFRKHVVAKWVNLIM